MKTKSNKSFANNQMSERKEQAVKVAHSSSGTCAPRLYSSRADGISKADRVIYRYKRTALLYNTVRLPFFLFSQNVQLIWSQSIKCLHATKPSWRR
jgi:hypothetical protein